MAAEQLDLAAWVRDLAHAVSFDEAAAVLLRAVRTEIVGRLDTSPFAQDGRMVRCVVHLRPGDGYRGLAVLEGRGARVSAPDAHDPRLSSTTAWRWVAETRSAVSIDVHVGRMASLGDGGAAASHALLSAARPHHSDFDGAETRLGLMARDVTHLLVLPLRGPRGVVDGMVSIEVACRPAIGAPFIWEACAGALQLLVDIAGPYVTALPAAAGAPSAVDPFLPVIGASMSALVEMLATFARQDEPILITGPTGSGKSRLARWCHERSLRKGKPFEVLDLCAVPEQLQMAELFGWKKGAFTGATKDKAGHMARAAGGTIFIDEIDNLSPRAQAGLLRVLEERVYRRLGDDGRELAADVRFIVGTNADLQIAVRRERFREDLYYRVNVLPVRLPPLRERPDEIRPWAQFMAERRHAATSPGERISITPEGERLLVGHPWPGNLRQLDNIVRRAYALAVMGHGSQAPASLVVDDTHVRRAIAYEDERDDRSVSDALLAAAVSLVQEAERRGPGALDLELADAFKGFVLGAAVEKFEGNREEAFALFGRSKLAKSRNHHKVLRREIERAQEFCRALGERRVPFAGLLSDDPDESGDDSSNEDA